MNGANLVLIKAGVIVGTLVLAVLLEALILPEILKIARKLHIYDIPNGRKIHQTPIPRIAGLSFMPVMVIVIGLSGVARLLFVNDTILAPNLKNQTITYILFAMGLTLLYLVGAADDLVGISYKRKACVQIVAACLLPIGGFWINNFGGLFGIHALPPVIGIPLTILIIVYIINAINLIDGLDGLAAGLVSIAMLTLAIICFHSAHFSIGILAVATLGILVVFLRYNLLNRPPRKLFMGDAGSMSLGYVLSLLIIHFWNGRIDWDPFSTNMHIISIVALAIPLLDEFHVFTLRLVHHRNPFLPDKTHIHHRLLACGISPLSTLFILCTAAIILIIFNIALAPYLGPNTLFCIDVFIWIVANIFISKKRKVR